MQRLAGRLVMCVGVLIAAVAVSTWGCLSLPGEASFLVGSRLRAEYVVSNADYPSALAFAADGRGFYTERKTGQIRVISDGAVRSTPLATVPVNYAGDRGLLGIAVHPEFDTNHRVYVFYTRSDTGQATDDPQAVVDNRVVYFELNGDVADGGEVFVASLPADSGSTRVGGRLAFASDGTLLVAIGDLTDSASASARAVSVGKILRYNDDGSIPDDNPVADSPFYARGLRDPRGLCIESVNGTPLVIDRNDGRHDEVNRVVSGANFGWPMVEGIASTGAELEYVAENPDYVDPILDTGAADPGLVGGSVNPSARYGPNTRLYFFYGEANTRQVITAQLSTDRATIVGTSVFASGFPTTITDVAFTPAGTLYVACNNAIFRLAPSE